MTDELGADRPPNEATLQAAAEVIARLEPCPACGAQPTVELLTPDDGSEIPELDPAEAEGGLSWRHDVDRCWFLTTFLATPYSHSSAS